MIKKFKAVLENPEKELNIAFVFIPFDVKQEFGASRVKVKATFDGHPYRGLIVNMGHGYILGVRKDIREAISKQVGDVVQVTIEKDEEERVVGVPAELNKLLAKNAKAKSFFDSLSFTNRKEYALWISSAKKEETKAKRLKEILTKLLAGKKNPSEK